MDPRFKELRDRLERAWQNFNFAEPAYIDVAILELMLAEEAINAYLRTKKAELLTA